MEKNEYCLKGNVYSRGEKFVKVKLVKSRYATSGVALWCCVVWACDLSIWAPSRLSVSPHRLRCHNKITGGLLDSSFPQGFLLTFFCCCCFLFFCQSLEQNLPSFALKYGEESLEKLKNGKCKVKVPLEKYSCAYENEPNRRRANVSLWEIKTLHFMSFSFGFQILTWWIPRNWYWI